jgi:hypothetical protein
MTEPTTPPLSAASGEPDQRSAVRRPAASVPGITGLRFSPHGIQATLVNISETGSKGRSSPAVSKAGPHVFPSRPWAAMDV